MKLTRIIACSFFAAFCGIAGGKAQTRKIPHPVSGTGAVRKSTPGLKELESGKLLISKSDCMGCHNPDNKIVGPAYREIASAYPYNQASIALLSQKIISGGSGKWGPVPMTPHPAVSTADAGLMVKYILSLRTK